MTTQRTHGIAALFTLLAASGPALASATEDLRIEPGSPQTGSSFGDSVAIGEDYLVAGSQTYDNVYTDDGIVTLVFPDPVTGLPSSQFEIAPSTLNDSAYFGQTVAASGDTFAVTAKGLHDTGGSPVGAVFVYKVNSPSSVTLQAQIQPAGLSVSDLFAFDIDLEGDTLAIGVPGANSITGEVWMYTRTGSSWSLDSAVASPHGDAGDGFGFAVALEQGSESHLIVSAPYDSDVAASSGRVYSFNGSSGWSAPTIWCEVDQTTVGTSTFRLGTAVDVEYGAVVVGETFANTVHVFTSYECPELCLYQSIEPTSSGTVSDFGSNIAVSNGLIVVGAKTSNVAGPVSGAGYLFRSIDGGLVQLAELQDSTGAAGYALGAGVALDGDIMILGSTGATVDTTIQAGVLLGWDVGSTPGCPTDVNMDAQTDVQDLLDILTSWGTCTEDDGCSEDLDGDSDIDLDDLAVLIISWGACG